MTKIIAKSSAVILALIFSVICSADNREIQVNKVVGAKEELILSILELALAKTRSKVNINQFHEEIPLARLVEDTDDGRLDIMWAGSSAELDEKLLAVRIPLLKGLLGHRIFIIRKGEQGRFEDIKSIESLSGYKAGMGRFWGSTKVLKDAGLNVITAVKYKSLFHMLDGGRFDYFPRAVHEPWEEVAKHPNLDLEVEEKLLLIYPYAMYFYLRKDNVVLHRELSRGLETAIADGSFDKLFYSNNMVKSAVKNANFKERFVMRVENPAMHPLTPTNRSELWLDIKNL